MGRRAGGWRRRAGGTRDRGRHRPRNRARCGREPLWTAGRRRSGGPTRGVSRRRRLRSDGRETARE
jgi:hypothetical protein